MSLRAQVHDVLELHGREHSLLSRIINSFIFILIVLNVVVVILESVERYRVSYGNWFLWIEWFSIIIFTVEYLLRVWASVEHSKYGSGWRGRLSYILSPMAIIDLLAILPFYFSMFVSLDARILRVFRLLRVFKLTRHFLVLEILGNVLRHEAKTLLSAIFVMLVMVILAASGIYIVEHDVQPEAFGSIPRAMWWAVVTLTTVGYGDVVPVTLFGKLFGATITILGVGMAALPAGIIASGFTSEMAHRRESYEHAVRKILQEGKIDADDRQILIRIRNELGLDRNQAQQVLRKAVFDNQRSHSTRLKHCPHCGEKLDSN